LSAPSDSFGPTTRYSKTTAGEAKDPRVLIRRPVFAKTMRSCIDTFLITSGFSQYAWYEVTLE